MEILSLEESAKAQALGTAAWVGTLDPSINYPAEGLQSVLQHTHPPRYRFATWQMLMSELVRASHQGLAGAEAEAAATAAVLQRRQWLENAEKLRQDGLYVDPHSGSTPQKFTKGDYGEAVAVVRPYVNIT